ncbi:hypothetical protein Bca52824_044383 [Brassica carinata]|uniref:Uncharacterized protein n=1 Tax=Brassica carinata TaxID=52824 RepID=A0A8X7S555_BRACI|nr:hypothetical protein Bca52824_044383 [Brassica carinata]
MQTVTRVCKKMRKLFNQCCTRYLSFISSGLAAEGLKALNVPALSIVLNYHDEDRLVVVGKSKPRQQNQVLNSDL